MRGAAGFHSLMSAGCMNAVLEDAPMAEDSKPPTARLAPPVIKLNSEVNIGVAESTIIMLRFIMLQEFP